MRGSSSPCRVAGPRVRTTRASEPLRRRILASGLEVGTRSEPRKVVRLGLWPTTRRFSRFGALAEKLLEVFEGGVGGERSGVQDLGFVAGFGADERCGLEAALERA